MIFFLLSSLPAEMQYWENMSSEAEDLAEGVFVEDAK